MKNKKGVYDLIISENNQQEIEFDFGRKCKPLNMIINSHCFFRNDTLIIDNGFFEYWCFIENDILFYSAYSKGARVQKFIKSE